MQDVIEIPVTYKNKNLSFKGRIMRFGYVSHIIVDINGEKVTIERDEEGNYRALGDADKIKQSKIDVELVEAVVSVLQSL